MKKSRARDCLLLLAVLVVATPFATALTRPAADWTVDPPPRVEWGGTAPALVREDLFDTLPTPLVHAPAAVETASGDLLVAWYGGSDEAEPDVGLYLARKAAGASSWQAPRRLLDRESERSGPARFLWSIGNPVFHSDDEGRLWLFHVATMAGWSTSWIEVIQSDDDGETWSVPRRLVTAPGPNISTLVKTRPFAYRDGRIGLPAYHELEARFALLLVLDGEGRLVDRIPIATADPAIQPAIAPMGGEEMVAMMRPYGPPYRVRAAHSTDGGRHWRDLGSTDLPNPGTAVAVAPLGGDDMLLAYNANERRRSDLALAMSRDGGATWSAPVIVDRAEPGDRSTEIAYPALLAGADGRIHLVYSVDKKLIRHIALNREWLAKAFPQ